MNKLYKSLILDANYLNKRNYFLKLNYRIKIKIVEKYSR